VRDALSDQKPIEQIAMDRRKATQRERFRFGAVDSNLVQILARSACSEGSEMTM
jgi:hypothetical protein